MKDSQIWLEKNFEPKSEVLQHWRNAYPLRRLSDSTTILEHFEKWPILKTEIAPELVNIIDTVHHQLIIVSIIHESLFQ